MCLVLGQKDAYDVLVDPVIANKAKCASKLLQSALKFWRNIFRSTRSTSLQGARHASAETLGYPFDPFSPASVGLVHQAIFRFLSETYQHTHTDRENPVGVLGSNLLHKPRIGTSWVLGDFHLIWSIVW